MGRGSFFDSTLRGLAQSFSGQSARSARSLHRGERIPEARMGGQVHAPNTEESICSLWRRKAPWLISFVVPESFLGVQRRRVTSLFSSPPMSPWLRRAYDSRCAFLGAWDRTMRSLPTHAWTRCVLFAPYRYAAGVHLSVADCFGVAPSPEHSLSA
jgi:hypothetical protein